MHYLECLLFPQKAVQKELDAFAERLKIEESLTPVSFVCTYIAHVVDVGG